MRAIHVKRLFIALTIIMALSYLASGCVGDEIEITSESIIKEKDNEKENEKNNEEETPSLKEPGLAWSGNSLEVVYGDEYVFPTLTNNYNVKVTYASSNPDVATVTDDGSVTIISAGTTTISASSSETSEYEAGSAAYTITVSRASGGLEWSAETVEAVYGEDTCLPEISNPNNLTLTWSSSDENVATVSSEGVVSIIGAGVTTIFANSEETSGYEAGEVSYVLTVKRAGSELGFNTSSDEVVFGQDYSAPELVNPNNLTLTWSSSDENVATVSSEGVVSIIGAGVTTIFANSEETSGYEACDAYYLLTVRRAECELGFNTSADEVVFGQDYSAPELVNPNNLRISWASSNENVATVSSEGVVSIIGAGVTTISASSEETSRYEAGDASYILTVKRAENGLCFNQSVVTAVIGQEFSVPELINPNNLDITWSSSDENIVTVSSDGILSIVGAGVATISATSAETTKYEYGNVSFTITISKITSSVSWSKSVCSVKIGEGNTFPSLGNPGEQEIIYSSSDENVAVISPDGTVILKGTGTASITATAKENATFSEGKATYKLEVAAQDMSLQNSGISWTENSVKTSIKNDSPDLPTLSNPNKLNVTYSSSSPSVAIVFSNGSIMLMSVGTTTITASSKATDVYAAGSASYILTVTKEDAAISLSNETYTVAIEGDESFPTLENPFDLSIQYTSSNTSVASIDSDGTIELISPGTTTITASTEASDFFDAASVSYTLTVTKPKAPISWSVNSATATLLSDNTFPELINTKELQITYSSSNKNAATIDSKGVITLVGGGSTTITATSKENDKYLSTAVSYKLTVNKLTPELSWSSDDFTAALNEANSYPTLNNPSEINVTYSSSNSFVARISSDGVISLNRPGTITITASFKGDNIYEPATASYNLNVVSSFTDDGIGTFTFSSTGDKSSDDDISNTTFKRMITITYSTSGDATVTGDYYGVVTIDGNKVSVNNNRNDENIIYKLTGATNNGYFKLASEKKQAILLDNASITNPNGAAINNQSGKRTFVVIEGSNTLSDGSSASYSSGSEDMKAVLFSEGQLVFSGDGSLTVNAVNKNGKSGILSDDYVRVMSDPTIKVISGGSAGHGVKGNDYVIISSGTLNISTAADTKKGIASDDYVLIEDGSVTIKVTGGVKYDSEDREYSGTAGIKADNYFGMTGGVLEITNTGDGGKGIRAGNYNYYTANKTLGASYISGGEITITTSGREISDVSSKAIKIGFEEATSYGYSARYLSGGDLNISGGKMILKSSYCEAIEIKGKLTVSGGDVYAYSQQEDAINSQGEMGITGGYIYALSEGNDAIDSNGNIRISGRIVYALTTNGTPEVAIDAATESGYKVYVEPGATIISYGGIEPGASLNQTCYTMSVTPGGINALIDENGKTIAVFKAPKGISSMVVSAPSLKSGIHGVTASGGSTKCEGYLLFPNSISGGEASTLKEYTPTSIWGN